MIFNLLLKKIAISTPKILIIVSNLKNMLSAIAVSHANCDVGVKLLLWPPGGALWRHWLVLYTTVNAHHGPVYIQWLKLQTFCFSNSIRWPLIPVNVGPWSRTQTRFVLHQLDYLSQSQKSLRVWILFYLRVEVQAVGRPTWTTISHTSATVSGVGTPGLSPLAFSSPLRFY